jgi:hypothetical protein
MHGNHIAGSTAHHIPGCGTHLQDSTGVLVNGNHRGFPDNDTLTGGIDQNITSTKVNAKVNGK